MNRFLLLALTVGLLSPISAKAEVDSKVHKMCLQAKDYIGCVKAQTTKPTDIPSLRVIRGKTELTGNSCPHSFAYAGAGKCRTVTSVDPSAGAKRKDWYDITHIGLLAAGFTPKRWWPLDGRLVWGDSIVEAVDDPQCPQREPYLYRSSSCQPKLELPPIKHIKTAVKKKDWEELKRWDRELFVLFGIENLASDNASNEGIPLACRNGVWDKNHPKCRDQGIALPIDLD